LDISLKLPGWEARLVAYLGSVQRRAFDPSNFHCGVFAADCVEAMTGVDMAAAWRGLSLQAGLRAIRREGFCSHVDLVAARLAEVAPSLAQPGDVAVVPGSDGPALGILQGAGVYVLGPHGVGLIGRMLATRAFRV
jgi:hypothetical protein